MTAVSESKEPLAGGGLGGAVRVGDTVRRQAGPWTPAVHALLHHLESVGFNGAPRALGLDDKGREVLSFVEGTTGDPAGPPEDDALVSTAKLVRRYHDAVEGFIPPANARWQSMVGAPREGPILAHNDLAPVNTIYANDRARCFIDWDFAAPATREWDIAYALWRFVPLYGNEFTERFSMEMPPNKPRRMRLFCDAYGLEDRSGLVDLVRRRVEVLYDSVRTWAEEGIPNYKQIWDDTEGRQWLGTIAFIDQERDVWDRALE